MVKIFRSDEVEGVEEGLEIGDFRSEKRPWAPRWLGAAKYLVAPVIILVMVILFLPTLLRAREPAYEARCLAKLKQIAVAVEMYTMDHDAPPPRFTWVDALRPAYTTDPENPAEPGSGADPLKCVSDETDATVSYLYLDRRILPGNRARYDDSFTPMAVDERNHRHTTLVFWDGHAERMDKTEWAQARGAIWGIRKDITHPETFSYELRPTSEGDTVPRTVQ